MDAQFKGIKNAYEHVTSGKVGTPIYSVFNTHRSNRGKRGGRRKQNDSTNGTFHPEVWIPYMLASCSTSCNMIHALRTEIFKLSKANLRLLFLDNAKRIASGDVFVHERLPYAHYVIQDMCIFKFKDIHTKPKKAFMVVKHINKLVDMVNLPRLINDANLKRLFPGSSADYYASPGVAFSYTKSIRSSIVNYSQTIKDEDYANFVCNCHNYPDKFIDSNHGHVFTGDVNIINNREISSLLNCGLDFHEQQPPNKDKALGAIKSAINSYIESTSIKMSLPVNAYNGWKINLINNVKEKLRKTKPYKYNNILNKPWIKNELSKLQSDFVFIPVDKASKNIAIICKKYYLEILTKEIEDSSTFEFVDVNKDQLLKDLVQTYPGKNVLLKLPYLYALAKMHKIPKNFRYITCAKETLFSGLSIAVSKCLKLLVKTANTSFGYKIKEIDNSVFIIDNRDRVLKFIDKANMGNYKNKCISTWDFSTLYTMIPHNKLKEKMTLFINRIFDEVTKSKKGTKFVCSSDKSDRAYFSKTRSKVNFCCTADELIENIKIIIENSFICFHNKIFRQVVGIPMGTNCAPYLANVFLHVYEYDYIKHLVTNEDHDTAKLLSHTFRYQDDCISMNDEGEFKNNFLLIYPPELTLKNTNISKAVCNFLDLRISVFRGKFRYKSYDKRDDFDFEVCNYPNLHGNIPWKGAYGVYISQLVRFCNINLSLKNFIEDVKRMSQKLLKQGYLQHLLLHTYLKFCNSYCLMWAKYGVNLGELHNNIFGQ